MDDLYSVIAGGAERRGVTHLSLVYSNAARLTRTHSLDDALRVLRHEFHFWVAGAAQNRVFLHSGVVGWRGRAILLPGRSGAGKSRLVAALVRAGASYYSDEYAPLDRHGRVHPFPIPLRVAEAGEADEPWPPRRRVEELGGRAGRRALPVGLVAIARYRPGSRWRPRRLSGGRGLLGLMDNAIPVRHRTEATLEALGAVVGEAPVVCGARGEAEATAPLLLQALEAGLERRRAS